MNNANNSVTPKSLQVYADGPIPVGEISRSQLEEGTFLFSYQQDTQADQAVSLTMPVAPDQYDSMGTLHPIFEMNLPEGMLRQKLELMFSKLVEGFDDMALLQIVGATQIGRLKFGQTNQTGANIDNSMPTHSVSDVLAYNGAEDLFSELLNKFAQYSGLSGMQPKVLLADAGTVDKITHKAATHIVKSFDPREYPELAANEYFCMRAARLAGLPVPNVKLSSNRRLLVVERFDRLPDGTFLGFEDFCVLSGMRSNGRYTGTYEQLAQRIQQFVSPEFRPQAMIQFFGTLVLSCAIGNGDAHLKNFGVIYSSYGGPVSLAPAYDLLSTKVYQPRDVMALSMAGSKTFPNLKVLIAFGRQHCMLSAGQCTKGIESVFNALQQVEEEIIQFAHENNDFETAANALVKVFKVGRGGN
jgi:serine/threonine-protein kinase HipA